MNLSFQFLDLAVVLIVIASAVYATYRGLVSESLAIFGWIAAAYATLYFGPWVAWWMQDMMGPRWLGRAAGYATVFLIVLIPLQFAASRIAQNVKKSQVGTLDSVLGTAFGLLRGIAIVGIAYLVFTAWVPPPEQPGWITRCRLYPVIRVSAEIVASLIPDKKVQAPREAPADPNDSPDPIRAQLERNSSEPPPPPKSEARPAEKPAEIAPAPQPKPKPAHRAKKTYGAKDRHALDKLIETTNSDKSGKP
ncbi:CvpA family protein [Rhizomicrobium electricum]|jgi:membrane protein required for colicin V production|uniref:CvpA family protein n=1 Tax=Rhizomicrobium electricum TaxID=480070 RepID=A0ABN1EEC2_9PROT|nr:CvpA family protein [Rhizomicrobium electricum]NIJ48261.1 putative membrane protein required for colicin V production [Rhizomicrobium electricum]